MRSYFGTYADFDTVSKKDSGALMGPDNAVGDKYSVDVEIEDGTHIAWLTNRFDKRIGYFDPEVSKRISLAKAQGLECVALLSFVAFTDHPDDGHYWGQMALICYNKAYTDEFEKFVAGVSAKLADGVRPQVDLGQEGVDKIIDSDGDWMPSETVPLPENEKGTAYLKRRKKFVEKMADQGRAGNKGCYVISWVFLLGLVTLVVLAFKQCSWF